MTKPEPADFQVVVAGDMPIDWNLARVAGPGGAGVRTSRAPGGAARLGELIATMAEDISRSTGRRIRVHAPAAPEAVSPVDGRFHHCHAVWAPYPAGDRQAWRIERLLGVDRADPLTPPGGRGGPARADLIVLHDANLGFRDQPALWPRALDHLDEGEPWILLRTVGPVGRGALWQRLQPYANRLIVVMGIADLRMEDVRISRELSWERTAQDLVWELLYNPRVSGLRHCAHLIVSFTTAGALVASAGCTQERDPDCVLVFDPAAMERMWNEAYQGGMIGGISTLTAGVAGSLLATPPGQRPALLTGVRSGIAAMRELDRNGYDEVRDGSGTPRLAFPVNRVIRQLARADASLAEARVADPLRTRDVLTASARAARDWTILADRYPGEQLEALAYRIVREGADRVLVDVPRAQYADLVTFDRHEIESFQSVRTLIRRYFGRPDQQPLSIAVFGPPGAGKSWGVKQVANSVAQGALGKFSGIKDITFNLSQFEDPHELIAALHQVRDISLGGKLPLVFWDEFDTTRMTVGGKQPLGWLAHFLAPMQDGTFSDGQLTYHIGPAVFVFAGGLFATMDDFVADSGRYRDLKAPDFISRLGGYVNILGPNPTGGDARSDPYYLVRRAVLLRSLLHRIAPDIFHRRDGIVVPDIDTGVLRALLLTTKYTHGARSVASIIGMSTLAGSDRLERSDLASEAQLALHVDAGNFLDLVHLADIDPELRERLAEAVHVLYCAERLAAGEPWTGDRKYLDTNPLLLPYAARQAEPPGTNPWLVGYEALPPERKAAIGRQLAELPNKLAASGYLTHPLGARPPLSDLIDLRCTLEAAAVTAAAEHGDPGQLAQADLALVDMRLPGATAEEFHDADVRFHVALAGASGSEPLHLLMLAIRGAMADYLIERLRDSADLAATLSRLTAEHAAIRQAIEDHDGALASELVRAHVLDFYRDDPHASPVIDLDAGQRADEHRARVQRRGGEPVH